MRTTAGQRSPAGMDVHMAWTLGSALEGFLPVIQHINILAATGKAYLGCAHFKSASLAMTCPSRKAAVEIVQNT